MDMNNSDFAFLKKVAALADPSGYSVRSMIKGKWGYLPVDAPITDDVLTQHLSRGEDCIGIRMNVDGGEKSMLCVFDFDDHDAEMDQADIFAKVKAVNDELTASHVPHLCFRSGGGQGAQVWIVFAEPRRTDLIRDFADHFLKKVNLTRKAGGKLINGEVEVLPKGSGAQIVALPYGRKSAELIFFDDGTHMLNSGREIVIVPYAGKKAGRKQAAATSSDVDRDAAFDCFVKKYDVDNRTDWGTAGICLQAAFTKEDDWAKDRWVTWSKTGTTYKAGDEAEWASLSPASKFTKLSFWRIAKAQGYKGASPLEAEHDEMNREWALINVAGKVEFLHLETMESSNIQSWSLLNKPREKIAETWLVSSARREYHNYVLEDPETYDGRGFNMYRGRPVEPVDGDVSLFKRYLLEVLCGGDAALAHWVTSWVADGVQRPWTVTPGTALALRGPQGSGKSFLGYAIAKVLGDDLTLAVVDSNYLMGKGNRDMFGKTFLLAEESLFVGSQRGANVLKNLVTRPDWRYEQKYLASFAGKNVHRLIATTNGSQAVLLDFDDRRWTVIEVNRACPFKSTSMEARQWWAPFYDLVENHAGVILKYLLDYPVDRDLIGRPHHTLAKAEDKTASDPLVALFHAMALTGVCPDDMRGDGRISTATLAREVIARGGSRQATSQTFSNCSTSTILSGCDNHLGRF